MDWEKNEHTYNLKIASEIPSCVLPVGQCSRRAGTRQRHGGSTVSGREEFSERRDEYEMFFEALVCGTPVHGAWRSAAAGNHDGSGSRYPATG